MKRYKAEVLDLVQSCYRKKTNPIIYCYMTLENRINIEQLKKAVEQTAKIVPQILCLYQERDRSWHPAWDTVDPFVIEMTANQKNVDLTWDLTVGPQLKIFIRHEGTADKIIFAMSHLLSDGRGFQQYLTLLNECYNGKWKNVKCNNERNLWKISADVDPKSSHLEKKDNLIPIMKRQLPGGFPFPRSEHNVSIFHNNIKVVLDRKQTSQMIRKAKKLGVTVNDYLMAAYVATFFQTRRRKQIILPVPADLRSKCTQSVPLTIANMTGKYLCRIKKSKTVEQLAQQIHKNMVRLKKRNACTQNLRMLKFLDHKIPNKLLIKLIRKFYCLESISYTNLGILRLGAEDKMIGVSKPLQFDQSIVTSCYMCGMYRTAPSFQVSISTYMQQVILSTNVIGTIKQQAKAKKYLERMKEYLMKS